MKKIDLQTFQGGIVLDMFAEELGKVLVNIEDENTVVGTERVINLRIAIKPDKTRRTGSVTVQANSTLAKYKPAESLLFFDRDDDGRFAAYEDEPGPMLPGMGTEPENVREFSKAAGGN